MNIARVTIGIAIATFSIHSQCADSVSQDTSVASLDAYIESLDSMISKRGELYCKTSSGGQRHPYKSCESFSRLREQGCFGFSTYDMSMEMRYESMCKKVSALATAHSSQANYFSIEPADWWKPIPAVVIPMSGSVYSDESWEIAAARRQKFLAGKQLGDLTLFEIESGHGRFAATLKVTELECGEIRNRLEMAATLFADFDGDGIAELLLEGYRVDRSDTCSLGTGISLGASFNVLIKKDSSDAQIVVLKIPGMGLATDR